MLNPDSLTSIKDRFKEVERLMSQQEVATDISRLADLGREHSGLRDVVAAITAYEDLVEERDGLREMVETEEGEMKEMAEMELAEIEERLPREEEKLKLLLIPKDPEDSKDAIVEIRAGTGGDEAALFAGDLYRLYERFAEQQGWKLEVLDLAEGSAGGFKEISFALKGPDVFGTMKYESGVHRVQRVPSTESSGRIHTSAATVAVLPEAEEVDVQINTNDLRIDYYRSSGPGGQSVNTTDSAVRITHIPTDVTVSIQDEKSQHKNKDKAMRVLRSRLYERQLAEINAARAAERKSMVGSGDRSAKIRTYNFPQDRFTDHRLEGDEKNSPLQKILDGSQLIEIIEALRAMDNAERLAAG